MVVRLVSVSETVGHQVYSEIPSINVVDLDAIFGSLPFSERFFSGYSDFSFPQKPTQHNTSKFQSEQEL